MSWTNDAVLEFLELYRREQHLWDPKHPLHRNRSEVTEAWNRIQSSISISCSITDLKRKKESLMTSFRMHFNKKKKSQLSYHTSWFAYPLMESFLGGKYECDSTNQIEHEFFNNATYPQPQQQPQQQDQLLIPDQNIIQRNNPTEQTKVEVATHSRPPVSQSNPANNRSNTNGTNFIYAKKEMKEETEYPGNTNERREIDEYDLYGQLLAKKLRKLEEHQRDVAMHEIDTIMFRAKIRNSSNQTRSYSSSPSPVPCKMKSSVFIAQQNHQQYEDENISYQEHIQSQAPS